MKDVFHKDRKEFQVERMILFSDAVFAIAITLLVIGLEPPEIKNTITTNADFWQAFVKTSPNFIGFLMSFAMIGLFWSKHHQMFGFVFNYTPKLIFLNLLLLFTIVLMPYSTLVYSKYTYTENPSLLLPFLFYAFNIIAVGLTNYILWMYIGNPKNNITSEKIDPLFLYGAKIRSLLLPLVFAGSFLFCVILNSIQGTFILFTIPIFYRLVKTHLRKKERKIKLQSNDESS